MLMAFHLCGRLAAQPKTYVVERGPGKVEVKLHHNFLSLVETWRRAIGSCIKQNPELFVIHALC